MKLDTFTETRAEALKKWKEYKAAEKVSRNPIYRELRKIYHQIKSGRKIIDIHQVIEKGGVHLNKPQNRLPKLSIARADQKKIRCNVYTDGTVQFIHDRLASKYDIRLPKCLPTFTWTDGQNWRSIKGEAPVPIIPPKFLPKVLTDDYYILWEVDNWKMVPPTDPWLLRRITERHFVVLDGWDLTDLEKSVMAAHLV